MVEKGGGGGGRDGDGREGEEARTEVLRDSTREREGSFLREGRGREEEGVRSATDKV